MVIFVTSDCEEKNKKALEKFENDFSTGEISPEMYLVSAIPDAVHLGKTFKCSWSNWFIVVDDVRTCLVLIRTLRDSARVSVRKQLRKLLSLECVRNKDRMSVDPILRLSSQEVIASVKEAEYIVHTLVPETYKMWNSNMPGVIMHPLDICLGPTGKVLVVDSEGGSIAEVKLHYPPDVKVLARDLSSPVAITFIDDIIYVALKGPANCIKFLDPDNKVKLKVMKLTVANLQLELAKRNLPTVGKKCELQIRLKDHLNTQDGTENPENIVVHVDMPSALTSFKEGNAIYLIYSETATSVIHLIQIRYTGNTILAENFVM